ncbi:hypothetical protein TNCV_497741 [Trichonephila clavipes]|nr:hypothetical protein TNCV_497741 [Trichonephila clavipes]
MDPPPKKRKLWQPRGHASTVEYLWKETPVENIWQDLLTLVYYKLLKRNKTIWVSLLSTIDEIQPSTQ